MKQDIVFGKLKLTNNKNMDSGHVSRTAFKIVFLFSKFVQFMWQSSQKQDYQWRIQTFHLGGGGGGHEMILNVKDTHTKSLLFCVSCPNFKTILYNLRKEMFYLTTHSTHFIYGYMALGII